MQEALLDLYVAVGSQVIIPNLYIIINLCSSHYHSFLGHTEHSVWLERKFFEVNHQFGEFFTESV